MRTLSFPLQIRQPFRVTDHLHFVFPDDVAGIEELLETIASFGIGAMNEGSTLGRVLLDVVFEKLVVAVACSLVGSAKIQSGLRMASSV